MKQLKFSLKYVSLLTMGVLALGGCSDSTPPPTAGGPVLSQKLFVSVEDLGVVKSIHLDEAAGDHAGLIKVAVPTDITATINFSGNPGAGPGEMIFSGGNAYVRVNNTDTVQMFDVASDGLDHNHAIPVGDGPIHMYKDKAEKVWILNDGAPTPNGTVCTDPTVHPGCAIDTVSVINGGEHNVAAGNIPVGNGHHKAAFSYPSMRVFVSNITDGTLSVIDNDPASPTYLQTLSDNVALNGNAAVFTGQSPHGIDYASGNGKVYNLNTGEAVNVISVIDPVTLAMSFITKGPGADQVPAVSRLHTRHAHNDPSDGRYVYILASTTDDQGNTDPLDDTTTGWVIVIDTMDTGFNNGIIAKTPISGMLPARIVFGPHGKRLYIPSGVPRGVGTPDLQINQLAVIDIDPASANFNTLIGQVTVGDAGGHGSIASPSADGHLLFVGNAGETTISVVDTASLAVVGTIDVGGTPSGMGVISIGNPGAGGHGH